MLPNQTLTGTEIHGCPNVLPEVLFTTARVGAGLLTGRTHVLLCADYVTFTLHFRLKLCCPLPPMPTPLDTPKSHPTASVFVI